MVQVYLDSNFVSQNTILKNMFLLLMVQKKISVNICRNIHGIYILH